MSSNQESTATAIKHALFKILNLPVRAVQGSEAWIEKEGHAFIVVVKTDLGKFRDEWKNNVNYSHDAVNSAENKHIVTFKVPQSMYPEVQQLQSIQDAPEGVANKKHILDEITKNINDKTVS